MPLKEKFNGKLSQSWLHPCLSPIGATPIGGYRKPLLMQKHIRFTPMISTELKQLDRTIELFFADDRAICHRTHKQTNGVNHYMKKLTLSLLTACAVATPAFAGVTVVTTKEYKQPVALPPPCFRDQELQLDLFYSYSDARPGGHDDHNNNHRGTHSSERFRDGSGGGVALNWFFARYFGISVEGNWWDGIENRETRVTEDRSSRWVWDDDENDYVKRTKTKKRHHKSSSRSVAHQVTANFVIRYPIEMCNICFAPYIFGGGGGLFDGEKVGFGDAGAGVEWRATENFGIFSDWRWIFTGKGKNDISQTRAGIRFVF